MALPIRTPLAEGGASDAVVDLVAEHVTQLLRKLTAIQRILSSCFLSSWKLGSLQLKGFGGLGYEAQGLVEL